MTQPEHSPSRIGCASATRYRELQVPGFRSPACGRASRLVWLAWIGCGWLLLGDLSLHASGEPPSSPAEMLADAELHDVLFLDPDRGWAVGDRGVIWTTEDGGRKWRLQDSPTTACLRSITFIDDQTGWIAGGWHHPLTQRSSAVLLRTTDGGRKWSRLDIPTMPLFRRVQFQDARRGWAVGDRSSLYPTGLFATGDGGHTWEAILQGPAQGFVTGTPTGPATGLACAADGSAWLFQAGQIVPLPSWPAHSGWQAVRFGRGLGCAVGNRGALWLTHDGGQTWNPSGPSATVSSNLDRDWQAAAIREGRCWVAGTPGSRVVQSADGGRTWQSFPTGQVLPLNQLCFLNEHHGWGVGPLGRILATRDGGQTWRVQQSGGERLAMLCLPSHPTHAPWELLAKVAADEGRLAAVAAVFASSDVAETALLERECLREAATAVGAATGLVLPAPPTGLGAAALREDRQREIVRQVRLWRPDILVTDNLPGKGADPRVLITVQAVLGAVQQAADPAAYPEQITQEGLQPWQVRKVFGIADAGTHAAISVDTLRLSPALGCSLVDYAAVGRGLLDVTWREVPRTVGCRLLWSQAGHDIATRDLFSGVPPAPVGESRRTSQSSPVTQVEMLTRSAQQLRNLQELVAGADGRNTSLASWRPQLEQLVRHQDPGVAGRILHRLACTLLARPNYPAAAQCLTLLVERFPDHPLADGALVWLLRYYGSREIRHAFGPAPLTRLPALSGTAQRELPNEEHRQQVQSWVDHIRQTRPALHADPRVQFVHYATERETHSPLADRVLKFGSSLPLDPPWQAALQAESRLASLDSRLRSNPVQLASTGGATEARWWSNFPRPVAIATETAAKPLLDGRLDEPCWEDAEPIAWVHPETGAATQVRLARDAEYLYVGVTAATGPSRPLPPASQQAVRQRDTALENYDRVTFRLDIDRDYASSFDFTVDERGWTNDRCSGDPRYDPQWFVFAANVAAPATEPAQLEAVASAPVASVPLGSAWIAEIAIPLAELGITDSAVNTVWGLHLQRSIPPHGESGLTTSTWPPASPVVSAEVPFGLLRLSSQAVAAGNDVR